MIRLFKHYIPNAVLLLGLFDLVLLVVAGELGWTVRAQQIDMAVAPIHTRIPQLVTFAGSVELAMIAVGVYGAGSLQSLRHAAARLLVAISLGVIFLSVIFFLVPAAHLLAVEPALFHGPVDRAADRRCASCSARRWAARSSSAASSCSAPARGRRA